MNTCKQERQFGFLFAVVFTIAAFWPWWPVPMPNPYLLGIAGVFALLGLTVPRVLRPLYNGWMKFGHALGWVNSRIILALVFFFFVTPTALIVKLLRYDPLRLRKKSDGSYWVKRGEKWDPESLRNQF